MENRWKISIDTVWYSDTWVYDDLPIEHGDLPKSIRACDVMRWCHHD